MEAIELPTKTNLIPLRVKKIKRNGVTLMVLDSGFEFTLPFDILPKNIEEGERVSLKILNSVDESEAHDEFARKLLEDIIN